MTGPRWLLKQMQHMKVMHMSVLFEGGASHANAVLGDNVGKGKEGASIPVDDLVPRKKDDHL
jgi:hypothetical protein